MPKKEALIIIAAVFLILAMAGSVLSANDSSMVLYLPFDEGSGTTAADISGNKNTGTINGATWVNGVSGKALSFDGVNDWVNLSSKSNFNFGANSFAVTAWINFDGLAGDQNILAFYTTINQALQFAWSTNVLTVWGETSTVLSTSGFSPVLNRWYYVAYVRNGNNWDIYVNGVSYASVTDTRTLNAPRDDIGIGLLPTSLQYFDGSIDEVRVYNRSLSASEIQQLYGSYTPPSNATTGCVNGLCAYYNFDEGSGSVAYDGSGKNNSGTIYGATYVEGKKGSALLFDGINDLVSIPDSANWDFSNRDFTINFWANFKSLDTGKGAISILDQFYDVRAWVVGYDQLGSTGNKGLYFRYSTDGTNVNKDDAVAWSPAIGSWYQITAIRSGSNINFYINGAQIGSDFNAGIDTIYNSNEALWIGCAHTAAGGDASGYCFNGTIDEVSIYNRALSALEIQELYGQTSTNVTTGCVNGLCAYYNFDEGSGTTANDSSGDGDTGTINGATWVDGVSGKALSFDGVSDVTLPDSDLWNLGANNFAITMWVNFRTGTIEQEQYLIGYNYGENDRNFWAAYQGQLDPNKLHFNFATDAVGGQFGGISVDWAPTAEQWYYFVVVRNGADLKIYINGNQVGSTYNIGTTAMWSGSTKGIQIGSGHTTGKKTDGLIDEVRIYNKALSEQEIQQLYGVPVNITPEKPTDISTNVSQNETLPPVNVSLNITKTCTDTDNGQNYFVKGNVNYKNGDFVSNVFDMCTSAIINGTMRENFLREYFCTSANEVDYEHYQCPVGNCKDGACVSAAGRVNCLGTSTIGDANRDETITPGDALLIANIALGIEPMPANKCCVDVDNNGVINKNDSTLAFNYYLNLTPSGNAGKKCYETKAARGILAKTGQAFGFGGTAGAGVFVIIAVIILLLVIYLLVKRKI